MLSVDRIEFRNRFWTAQLIAGTTLATKAAHSGWHEGGFLTAAAMGVAGFLIVMPVAALIVWFMLRTGLGTSSARTRWLGAVLTGLGICAAIIAVGFIAGR